MPTLLSQCADGCNSTSACCPLNGNTCDASAKFLMSPVADTGEMQFSPCSLGNICELNSALVRADAHHLQGSLMRAKSQGVTNTTCLIDPTVSTRKTISLQQCGNGIVEPGEDCDPGKGSNSTCCDVSTCKFASGAICDPSNTQCCTPQCTFAPSTQVCRPAQDVTCDIAEMCTGNSSACPADVTAPNGG